MVMTQSGADDVQLCGWTFLVATVVSGVLVTSRVCDFAGRRLWVGARKYARGGSEIRVPARSCARCAPACCSAARTITNSGAPLSPVAARDCPAMDTKISWGSIDTEVDNLTVTPGGAVSR